MTLEVARNAERLAVSLDWGEFGLVARPYLSPPILAHYERGRTVAGGERANFWREAAQEALAHRDTLRVHFASHAFIDERFPLDSALVLSPGPAGENGLLQAWEIFDAVRLDADLVTLSACETALGREMGGEGLLGLTRAFFYAGARSVLASLWSVSDKTTPDLMRRFYRHLARGAPKDQALRDAQVEMIRAGGSRAHPFRWAAFQVFGDWR